MTWNLSRPMPTVEQLQFVPVREILTHPRARHSDPPAAHEAATTVTPSAEALQREIRRCVWAYGPLTAWQIAHELGQKWPGRWRESTIRSACAPRRSGLHQFSAKVDTDRGPKSRTFYFCPTENVDTNGLT